MAGFVQRMFWRLWKEKFFLFVVAANTAQFLGRLGFAASGLDGGIDKFLEGPAPSGTVATIHAMFLLLGIAGVPVTAGFAMRREWGIRALVILSAATIAFDVWGYTVQQTAALGFIVPAMSLTYVGITDLMSRVAKRETPVANL